MLKYISNEPINDQQNIQFYLIFCCLLPSFNKYMHFGNEISSENLAYLKHLRNSLQEFNVVMFSWFCDIFHQVTQHFLQIFLLSFLKHMKWESLILCNI